MDNEKIIELTKKQMEKVSGGAPQGSGSNSTSPIIGLDCFICPGYIVGSKKTQKCGRSLKQVPGKVNVYRCDNGNCELCGDDQYPMG